MISFFLAEKKSHKDVILEVTRMTHDFKQLQVWEEAVRLTEDVYRLTKMFPPEELFGITSQLRRATVSIASNIAEGCGKNTNADFRRYLHNAYGSCKEVECQLLIVGRLQMADGSTVATLVEQCRKVAKMLYRLQQAVGRTE